MKFYILFLLNIYLIFSDTNTVATEITLEKGWKFRAGDDLSWSGPDYDDSEWNPISIAQSWENQGYANYDGFGWYRIRVVIPSSLKELAYLKDSLQFVIGKVDDDDQFYLNGHFIGQNSSRHRTSDSDFCNGNGFYLPERKYVISASDPNIHWDRENIIAIRVFDQGGGGGLYAGIPNISMVNLSQYFNIDRTIDYYKFGNNYLKKTFFIRNTSKFNIKGNLSVDVEIDNSGSKVNIADSILELVPGEMMEFPVSLKVSNESTRINFTFRHFDSPLVIYDTEELPFILTPESSRVPAINGARIVGVRPDHTLLFTIPVTGMRPIFFEAKDLPPGVYLNKEKGILTGKVSLPGEYDVTLVARNNYGEAKSTLTIKVGDQIMLTPPMGWNSWNCWGLSIDETRVLQSAKAFVEKGLVNHGWSFINIDDGWQAGRETNGEIIPNEKFVNMKVLGDSLHQMGLKFGIYSSPGPLTCGRFTGSFQHEIQDAKTYAQWGVDYLKYDWCSYASIAKDASLPELKKPYLLMKEGLENAGRDIVFSLCQYGAGEVWKWGTEVGGNLWRTTGDITDMWEVLQEIGFSQIQHAAYAGPGHWNDPDMLIVGWLGWGPNLRPSRLTPNEQYTHISLWCLLSAPLLLGCDLTRLDDFTLNLLTNDEVLAVDQDPLGKQAVPVYKSGNIQIWAKDLADGSKAIGIFNLGASTEKVTVSLVDLGFKGKQILRDIWRQKNIGEFEDIYNTSISRHGVQLLKLTAK